MATGKLVRVWFVEYMACIMSTKILTVMDLKKSMEEVENTASKQNQRLTAINKALVVSDIAATALVTRCRYLDPRSGHCATRARKWKGTF